MRCLRNAIALFPITLIGLILFANTASADDRGTLQDMFDYAAEYSAESDFLRAIIVHDIMLRAFSRTGNERNLRAVCENLTASVPAQEVTHFNLSFWHCSEDELVEWLGNIDEYRSIEPVLIRATRPRYPSHVEVPEGYVVLRFDISETGDSENIEVLESSDFIWEAPAVAAVEDWKYRPARRNGTPVRKIGITQKLTFKFE